MGEKIDLVLDPVPIQIKHTPDPSHSPNKRKGKRPFISTRTLRRGQVRIRVVESCLRWLGHVRRRPEEAHIRRVEEIEESQIDVERYQRKH